MPDGPPIGTASSSSAPAEGYREIACRTGKVIDIHVPIVDSLDAGVCRLPEDYGAKKANEGPAGSGGMRDVRATLMREDVVLAAIAASQNTAYAVLLSAGWYLQEQQADRGRNTPLYSE